MLIFPVDHLPRLIPVGVQTSKGVEEIGFNVSAWLDKWPDMTFEVWPTRPTETAAYPAVCQLIGDVLVWYVSDADTAFEGLGTVEVVGIAEGVRKPSGPCTTEIKKTSLGATKDPPEGIKPYYEGMMEAAQVIKENVDVGTSGLYIVRATPDPDAYNIPRADRSQEEIRAAVAAGKTVLLVYSCVESAFVAANEGRVFTYAGEIIKDNGSTCPTFEGYLTYRKDDSDLLMYWKAYVKPGGTVGLQGDSPKTRTPHKLKLTGAVTAEFDGSEEVTVEIPQGGGVPDPGTAHQQLVSDEEGVTVWEDRTHYDVAHSVAWDGDTSGHVLADQNKTYANKQIKLVKVSGMTPTPEELVSAGAKVTNSEANRTGTSWATDTTTTFSGANSANENGWECCSEDGGFLVAYKAGYQYVYVAVAGTIELTYTMPEPGIYFVLFEQRSTPRTKCTKLEWRDLKQLDEKYIPSTIARKTDLESAGGGVQPDWNQNDPTAADYVKNRTHYSENVTIQFADDVTIEIVDGQPAGDALTMDEIIEGQTYTITWDGTVYNCVAYIAEGPNTPSLGNGELAEVSGGNGEPFFITVYNGATMVFANAGTYTVSVSTVQEVIAKIDEKFIPDSIARKTDLEALGGSGGAFVVTFSASSFGSNGTFDVTPDKTFSELYEAWSTGTPILAYLNSGGINGQQLMLGQVENYVMVFYCLGSISYNSMGESATVSTNRTIALWIGSNNTAKFYVTTA